MGNDKEGNQECMANLLEKIDLLVNKEKEAELSSHEDRVLCAREVKDMDNQINATQKESRKAVRSPGAGFHAILDSQPTPPVRSANVPNTPALNQPLPPLNLGALGPR